MEYYNALLESYNKLKKRELTIKVDEGKYKGAYLQLDDDGKRFIDARLVQEFGPNLNNPSKSLPLSNKDKKFFTRAQAYIFGDPKSKFKVKFNHLETGKELTLVHSDGMLDWDRFRQYRNQLAIEYLKRQPVTSSPSEFALPDQNAQGEEEEITNPQGELPPDLVAGNNLGMGQDQSMMDSFFNSEGEINTPEHHLQEVLANLVYIAKQKSFFLTDHPMLVKGDDESYPGLKNFLLMDFSFKLQSAFGLQLNPLNKTYLPQPYGEKDTTHIIKILETFLKKCIKFHEDGFLEEDAIWVGNHFYINEFGLWIVDPLLLNFNFFIDSKEGLFHLAAESFNYAYQEWANQQRITASYKIENIEFNNSRKVSKFNNDPYSLDLILPSVGTNISNLFRERVGGMNNDSDIAHFVLAFNNNLNVIKNYVSQFLTGQLITSNQVLDFEQLLATKIPEFSNVVNLISPMLKSSANLKNTQNRFYIYTQPRAIKIGEKTTKDLTPIFPELEIIDKAFLKIKLQRTNTTELRRESFETIKAYLRKSSLYQTLQFVLELDDIDLEDDYFVGYVREYLKAEYIINKINNSVKESKVSLLNNLIDYVVNDFTYSYIINSLELIEVNKKTLKFNTSIVNPLSHNRLYIHPGLYVVINKYIEQGTVKSKIEILLDYNHRDRVLDKSLLS